MGLKLAYFLDADVDRARAFEIVERLHEFAGHVGFDEVSSLRGLDTSDDRLRAMCYPIRTRRDGSRLTLDVRAREALWFDCTTSGAEPASFGLGLRPERVRHEGRQVRTGLGGRWCWQDCSKTQYAALPEEGGPSNFLRAHTGIVAVLDEAVRLGVDVDVIDDGYYWERRDHDALLAELHRWNVMIAGLGDMLLGLTEDGFPAPTGPILEHPDFERLAAEARAEMRPDGS